MKVVIQDRTEELNSRLRAYTVRRLGKLSRHFEKVLEAEVHFDAESRRGGRPRKAVKILVHMDGRRTPVLKAEERGQELQATLDLALDQVDRQVLKLKDKIIDRHRHGPSDSGSDAGQSEPADTVTDEPERVIQRVKAESIEQAIAALEANGHLFHLFLDEDSGEFRVIYRRADGSVTIIEPLIT
jgi:putative sigma-54 modulation protein